jgi:hypothetical protein
MMSKAAVTYSPKPADFKTKAIGAHTEKIKEQSIALHNLIVAKGTDEAILNH